MSMKSLLKDAREAIDNKEYNKSLQICKIILKQDKNNYVALVFLGISIQEVGNLNDALNAFKKAININATNPLAWNGLINYYRKIDSDDDDNTNKIELIKAYLALINIETNEKKLTEIARHLTELKKFGDINEITITIFSQIQNGKISNEFIKEFWSILIDLLSDCDKLPDNLSTIYENALKFYLNNDKTATLEYYSLYLNFLYKQNKFKKLIEDAEKMHLLFNTDTISLNWICKVFNENFIENNENIKSISYMRENIENLFKLESNSSMGLFTKAIIQLINDEILDCVDILKNVVNMRQGLLHAWILLSKCYLKLNIINESIDCALRADKLLKTINNKKKLRNHLDCILIESLSRSLVEDNLKHALNIYNSNEIDNEVKIISLIHYIRAHINLGNYIEVELLMKENRNINLDLLKAQYYRKRGKFQEALDILLKTQSDSSEWWLEIGLIYWELKEFNKSLLPFLKAAKLNSNNYYCFLLLGNYYKYFNDFDKARRCYEKSYKINSKSSDICIELSKLYRQCKNWNANSVLLQNITNNSTINKTNSWAWLQLGLSYLEQEDYDKAIENLRYVIRIDENNTNCWEALADAYLARGAYNSALKCYQKSLTLGAHNLYPSLQIANIKKIIGEYAEANANFEEILAGNKYYILALKGIAETCLCQARECYKAQRLGATREYLQYAVNKIISALQNRNNFSCLWKLLADCCIFITKLPEDYCCLSVPAMVIDGGDSTNNKILEKDDLFILTSRCYCRSLNLIEDNISIWYDLACCYLSHALNIKNPEEFEKIINKAEAAIYHCLSLNAENDQYWNFLGYLELHKESPNYANAQSAFIKSVTINKNNAVSWCNLGILYYILNEFKLANLAFSQAQRSDHNYVNSWVGQALIAEYLRHEDAMDLFRHSTQLDFNLQGALGYGYWVCKTLMESPPDKTIYAIHNMHAIPVACDVLTWYTEKNPDDAVAWNMLGIMQERLGLNRNSTQSFKYAVSFAPKEFKDIAKINYGRCLCRIGKYKEALKILYSINKATLKSVVCLALILFKVEEYEESYETYEAAINWMTDKEDYQSELLVALASLSYQFQGTENVQILLDQSIELKNPSPWAYYASLALAILNNKNELTKFILNKLRNFKNIKSCLFHYATFLSFSYLLDDNCDGSIIEISKLIHQYPDQGKIWCLLSTLLLRYNIHKAKSASSCAQIAMKLGQSNMDVTKVLCLVSYASYLANDQSSSLIAAQKAIHYYPDVPEGWAMLLTIFHKKGKSIKSIKNFLQNLKLIKNLENWTNNLKI